MRQAVLLHSISPATEALIVRYKIANVKIGESGSVQETQILGLGEITVKCICSIGPIISQINQYVPKFLLYFFFCM
jgi:hypothetical protein